KTLDLSSNQLNSLNFVGKFENLEKFDASHNRFSNIPAKLFDSLPNVTELNWSFNKIATFDNETFAKLTHLCLLDLRNNEIQSIDKNFFENNPKLKELRLENNRIVRFDCNIFPILQNSLSDVQKSTNFESDWETLEELDLSCMGNLHLELDHEFGVLLRGSYNFVFRFAKETFRHLKYFNISGLHLENTSKLLALLGPSLQKLDISANFVGALNAHTFETFENLQVLNVSQTNLSNFGFETFYHQRKLSQLDLSYNQLKKVNFTLLFRNFKELKTLNLEGNDLVELNTVTHLIFPNLTSLAISRNRFSCDYLAILLLQWHNLHLVNNPSNQTHIDGVDCYHDKGQSNEKLSEVDKSVETKTEITTEIEQTSTELMDSSENSTEYSTVSEIHMDHSQETNIEHNYYLLELRIVEFLLVVSVVVSVGLCILLRRKQKTRKMECNSKGSKQIARSGPHDIELIEHDVFNE
ncbi:leucine-rich repeats and immunoglobulin-like domains protein 2, partial [Contarinia nasturtii]|uniref:leucine-rich repeats and immunoglobulin-like domains protein 2 n=1 Tax=Contarinia nasturtii TaxID=265458 RepID=UPI0012D459EB